MLATEAGRCNVSRQRSTTLLADGFNVHWLWASDAGGQRNQDFCASFSAIVSKLLQNVQHPVCTSYDRRVPTAVFEVLEVEALERRQLPSLLMALSLSDSGMFFTLRCISIWSSSLRLQPYRWLRAKTILQSRTPSSSRSCPMTVLVSRRLRTKTFC